MKTIKQLREEYENNFLSKVETLPEEIMLESKKDSEYSTRLPSTNEMPMMILFRRIQFRVFPNRQIVGLYYSKTMNKYLSIPFGPHGNLNLSESVIYDDLESLEEDWQDVNRKDRTSGMSRAAVKSYRREHPGSKLQTAVTEKNPSGKRAARRKSFCSRMGGMKKRLTSAKTARDPDSRINKALRRWNCEEEFRSKLNQLREERLDEFGPFTPLVAAAGEALTGAAVRGLATAGAEGLAAHVAKRGIMSTGKSLAKRAVRSVARSGAGKFARSAGKHLLKKALTPDDDKKQPQQPDQSGVFKIDTPYGKTKTFSSGELARNRSSDIGRSLETQASRKYSRDVLKTPNTQNENTIQDIRSMIDSDVSLHEMAINGKVVTLNNSMAKRIVELYDSVNTKNKRIVEGMLNEDLESFRKLLNFSIKV